MSDFTEPLVEFKKNITYNVFKGYKMKKNQREVPKEFEVLIILRFTVLTFTAQHDKMVRQTLKILHHLLQNF